MSEQPIKLTQQSLEKIGWPTIQNKLALLTQTARGAKLAKELLPMVGTINISDLEEQLAITSAASYLFKKLSATKLRLNGIADIESEANDCHKQRVLEIEVLFNIFNTLENGSAFLELISDNSEKLSQFIERQTFEEIKPLVKLMSRYFASDGSIDDQASPKLFEIRKQKTDLENTIRSQLRTTLSKDFGEKFFQDDYITIRENRLVLPLKVNMKGKFKGIIHGSSGSGQTYFIEPESIVDLNNDYKLLCKKEADEVFYLQKTMCGQIGSFYASISNLLQKVAQMDLVLAKAKLSSEWQGEKPKIVLWQSAVKPVVIKNLKHPILLLNGVSVIGHDWQLDPQKKTILITGANMGGKTVALSSLGLVIACTQAGVLPPVTADSIVPVFTKILVERGDSQSIDNNLSSFGGHITKISQFLDHADQDSLVIIDEIMASTGASEGSALALAVIEALQQIGSFNIISTHLDRLKVIGQNSDSIECYCLSTDPKTKQPLFSLEKGVSADSGALETAKRLGISEIIIDRAINLLDPESKTHLSFIEREQDLKLQQENVKKLEEKWQANIQALESEKTAQISAHVGRSLEKLATFEQIADQAKQDIKALIKELKKQPKPDTNQANQQIDNLSSTVANAYHNATKDILPSKESRLEIDFEKLKQGVSIEVKDPIGSDRLVKAIVLDKPNNRGEMTIAIGQIRTTIHIDNVTKIY